MKYQQRGHSAHSAIPYFVDSYKIIKSCNYGVQKAPPFSVLMLRRIEKGGVFMKKKTISLILALILLLSCSATAQATSVQAATPSASITINGTTATCRVSIAKPGKTIHATLQLWQGRTMIDSWSGNGTSYLLITGSHEVTKGKTYTVKVVCTVDGQSFYVNPATATA